MSILEAALAYAARGWRVFPCHPDTKRPLTSGGFKDASKDSRVIEAWWTRFPKAMIGVPTGKATGAFVIDLDLGDPQLITGKDYLDRLIAHVGEIPHTAIAETPSGGLHLYFAWDDRADVDNGAQIVSALTIAQPDGATSARGGKAKPAQIDTRGEGGYVIVPPSLRADGRGYSWIQGLEDGIAEATDLIWYLALKGALEDAKRAEPPARPKSEPAPTGNSARDRAVHKYVLAALRNQARNVERALPGMRNQALNDAALSLGHLAGAAVLGERDIREALEQAAAACGLVKDDGIRSVRATIASGLKAGVAQPADLSGVGLRTKASRARDRLGRSNSRLADGAIMAAELRSTGFDIERLNKEFALVLMGSKAVVFFEQPAAMIEDQKRMLSLEAFNAWFANQFTEIRGADGKIRSVTWAKAWQQSKQRRSYRGIEFHPDPNGRPGTQGYLNLWSGFAVEPMSPRDGKHKYKTFRDHLLNNVCRGDAAIFNWVFGFFAHIVQRPRERVGVALVLRGKMGSGKTKVGEVFGSLYPRHYFLVDDPRYVTGQFNAHMATCLLLQADEAVWAGDKAAEGRLKGLVTSPIQQIEAKGVDPIRLPNYVRLIMTSNEEWVVPAAKDERRFCVLDVDPRCAQSHDYFREMDEELANGGLECLLADLLAFDLASINLRQIPLTEALLEQKIRSFDSIESWWFDRLSSGSIIRGETYWQQEVPCAALFDSYIHASDKIGIRRKKEETIFGMTLVQLVPELERVRRVMEVKDRDGISVPKRVYVYLLPSLERAREHFEELVGQTFEWSKVSEEAEEESESVVL